MPRSQRLPATPSHWEAAVIREPAFRPNRYVAATKVKP